MSYRTFKHLLGETSLERKCRFIFGGGLFVLVSLSFSWYGAKTEALVGGQTRVSARRLVQEIIYKFHSQDETKVMNPDGARLLEQVDRSLKKTDDLENYEGQVIRLSDVNNPDVDPFEREALGKFLKSEAHPPIPPGNQVPKKQYTFLDGSPREYSHVLAGRKEFQYVQAVPFNEDCIGCHAHTLKEGPNGLLVKRLEGELACAVSIRIPMAQTNRDIHNNRAILISVALVTALVAMFASYVIVRYVIVKPVKHLRDVSDAIAAGKLTIRSQIQTGDEFEDLSHAFNRMLHNLVAMQHELRDVNHDLDKKVDELAQANLALFEMNRLKSDFLATMSHELRTPLNSIIGFSEILAGSDALHERQRRFAANIQTSGKMLLGMINDILDLAKIESGKMEVRPEDFSIRDVCEALANISRPIAERKNIDLVCRLDEAIPLLRQDPGKIRQIIYNLLSNAIKFTPEGGKVTLDARTEGRNVVISVADTGIGIAEEDRDKIFEKFRQAGQPGSADSVLTREHQGSGLGLSIVRELAKLLGGDVTLESRLGQGSTFTVRIPMQLPGNRKFEVNLSDERIDLSKARRVEARAALAHLGLAGPEFATPRRTPGEPPRTEPVG
jgi:two-component system, NarL family, sensor histidine kinase BarA